jgi:hypothetical protein
MARTTNTSRRTGKKALPVLGIAGASLAMAGGAAYASTGGAVADVQSQTTSPQQHVFLGEEELSDVSLSTFYVFDKENAAKPARLGDQVAWGCRCGCGGCRCGGCRCGWRGCGGCGGCGGCCWSWGRCNPC